MLLSWLSGEIQVYVVWPQVVTRGVCLQYNDVPGSDEEMELGLGSDASLASSCGKHFSH